MLGKIFWLIIHLPSILWELVFFLFGFSELKEYAQKPFACPCCGERFYVK